MSAWRDSRNARSLARLQRALPAIFPAPVLTHALSRPFIPPIPSRAVASYWRAHPLRADRLARALARASGTPEGWTWRLDGAAEWRRAADARGATEDRRATEGRRVSFRAPPAPYREAAQARGPGQCCVCGQPVFRFGWHRDLWGDGRPNGRSAWHAACVAAWQLWNDPVGHGKLLRRVQGRRCHETGRRLLRDAEVDHLVPLHQVWREHRDLPWPDLLAFWGAPNLRVMNRDAHRAKSGREAGERASRRRAARAAEAASPEGPP